MVNEIFCGRDVPRLARTPFPAGLAAMALSLSLTLEAGACEDLSPGPQGRVTEVVDGDTVMLEDGLVVRMIGTQAPKLPLGREGFETWPLAEEAKAELSELVLGETVALGYGGERRDRYDRALAHVFVLDGAGDVTAWAQEHMVANGLARVYSFPDNRRCLEQLFAAERQARADRLGIWSHPYYSLRDAARPETILAHLGGYELVEGRVLAAEAVGERVFLNFGRNFRTDFTIVVERAAQRLFAADGIDLLRLENALVRVRGWVDERDGPRIEVTHPEQIEVLSF
jgi:micrococcal nuclease